MWPLPSADRSFNGACTSAAVLISDICFPGHYYYYYYYNKLSQNIGTIVDSGWLQTEQAQISSLHPILNTLPFRLHTHIYYNHSVACEVIWATFKIY